MKIALVHNFHRRAKPSGEDVSYTQERELLRRSPHVEVATYERSTDETAAYGVLDKARLAARLPFDPAVYDDFRAFLDRERPDLVHVQNTFPLLTSAVHVAAHRAGYPVIQTLRNHFYFCARATCDRDGRECKLCLHTRTPWHAVRYGCYQGSRLMSVPVARMVHENWKGGVWEETIDAFIALTPSGPGPFVEAGLPAERFFVKPNFVPDPLPLPARPATDSAFALFVGRLTREKGIEVLLEAAAQTTTPIKLIGSAPEAGPYLAKAEQLPNVEVLGRHSLGDTLRWMHRARCVVVPSVCPETFGRTVVEAFAVGTPVVASNLGGPADLVAEGVTGRLVPPGDASSLARALDALARDAGAASRMGQAARADYERHYTPEINERQLLTIYREVLARRAARPVPTP